MRFGSALSWGLLAFSPSLVSSSPNPLPVDPRIPVVPVSSPAKVTNEPRDLKAPELLELTGENFYERIGKGYWFIKHYSPTCRHCKAVAPIWRGLVDFYTTSTLGSLGLPPPNSSPDSPSSSPSFTETYDFHFANLNCLAWSDTCVDEKLEITGYPTLSVYKDGKLIEQFKKPNRDLRSLSDFVEKFLEEIKPGSRPKTPISLPTLDVEGKKVEQPKKEESKKEVPKKEETENQEPKKEEPKKEELKKEEPKKEGNLKATSVTKVSAPTHTPNLTGRSVQLDAETFQRLVTTTRDPWFVKFYAPWCAHCQAMAPAWDELGREMKGKLNIGEVDCVAQKRLCKDVKLRGYPTILFFQGGERVEYDGLRGLGDLVAYAKKAVDSDIKDVDFAGFEAMEKNGMEVAFIYFYDEATTSEDFAALERVTLRLIGHAPLLKTDDRKLARRFKVTTWPRLVVIRDGKPTEYVALSPRDMRDTGRVLAWMRSVWLPIVPELSAANSHEIMNGKTVVLGILSRNRPNDFAAAKGELRKAAHEFIDQRRIEEKHERQELRDKKQLRIDEADDRNDERALRAAKNTRITVGKRKEVGFAWVDGVFWERWVRSTYGVNVAEVGERIIINDEDEKHYWDVTLDGNPIRPSRSAILDTLKAVISEPSKIQPKSSTNRFYTLLYKIRAKFWHHPWITVFGAIAGITVAAFWGRRRMRRRGSAGFFRLDGKEGLLGLGGNVEEKKD